jgi:hypothetical protein
MPMVLSRILWAAALALVTLLSCGSPPSGESGSAVALTDPARQPEYLAKLERLREMNEQAREHYREGRRDEAATLVTEGQPLSKDLLAISRPTLAAMEAASDLDQLYGDLLLENRHYLYARQLYQRNVGRWKHWQPQTDDTRRRLQEAQDAIARCDRLYSETR